MVVYLDADIFLALLKEEDRYKKAAQQYFQKNKNSEFVTSSLTCLEIWFYLHRNNLQNKAFNAMRAIRAIATIIDYGVVEIEAATLLAEKVHLTPADAIHAVLASRVDGIVSTDNSFDRISGLKRIDFSTFD